MLFRDWHNSFPSVREQVSYTAYKNGKILLDKCFLCSCLFPFKAQTFISKYQFRVLLPSGVVCREAPQVLFTGLEFTCTILKGIKLITTCEQWSMWIILSLYLFNFFLKKSHGDVLRLKDCFPCCLKSLKMYQEFLWVVWLLLLKSRKCLRQKQLMKQKNEIRFSEAILAKKTKSFTL